MLLPKFRKMLLMQREKNSMQKAKRVNIRGNFMLTRVAIIGIIVEDLTSVEALNAILHEYSQFIIGRMGIPYPAKNVNVISVAIDAPQDSINALTGKIGSLHGISAKAVYSNVSSQNK